MGTETSARCWNQPVKTDLPTQAHIRKEVGAEVAGQGVWRETESSKKDSSWKRLRRNFVLALLDTITTPPPLPSPPPHYRKHWFHIIHGDWFHITCPTHESPSTHPFTPSHLVPIHQTLLYAPTTEPQLAVPALGCVGSRACEGTARCSPGSPSRAACSARTAM